jgi:hypothetical protein
MTINPRDHFPNPSPSGTVWSVALRQVCAEGVDAFSSARYHAAPFSLSRDETIHHWRCTDLPRRGPVTYT